MISKQNILLAFAIIVLFSLLMFTLFGEHGLADLNRLETERDMLLKKNDELIRKNLSLYREIERLKNDPEYVENVARNELGVIGKDEVVIKVKKGRKAK
ncbi:MAG: septum formation initiator family protein [Thermodesulfobacteriota bacterium]|nr:septum formation initiator family protein [Thermodesulfobacteriota bacterium]